MRPGAAICLGCSITLISSFVSFAPAITTAQGQSSAPQQSSPQQPPAGGERKAGPAITFQVPPMPELPNNGLGDSDQPIIPGQPWRVRDVNRPRPADITPGKHLGDPPSDALVLFDGTDLSHFTVNAGRGAAQSLPPSGGAAPTWKVENGYTEVTPGAGSLVTKDRFKDFQLHLEFAEPPVPLGAAQYRGNSGVIIGGREIQILDNYKNPTYADGYVAAVYGMWPPLSNPSRPPGEWQTLDAAYMAARYDGDKPLESLITVFLNG
jgi:hypothetical protein